MNPYKLNNFERTFAEAHAKDQEQLSNSEWTNLSLSQGRFGPNLKKWLETMAEAIDGPPPKQPAHSHLADIDLLNRLRRFATFYQSHPPTPGSNGPLLLDIWDAVKPGDIGSAISEAGILAFATGQWGQKSLDGILLKACAELGEACDEVIKTGEGRSTPEAADMEVGDVLVVLSQYAAKRGTSLDALRAKAFRKCQERAVRMAMIEEDNTAKFVPPVDLMTRMVRDQQGREALKDAMLDQQVKAMTRMGKKAVLNSQFGDRNNMEELDRLLSDPEGLYCNGCNLPPSGCECLDSDGNPGILEPDAPGGGEETPVEKINRQYQEQSDWDELLEDFKPMAELLWGHVTGDETQVKAVQAFFDKYPQLTPAL